ncbi:MAG: class I SAM-dependent methyltransferase [Rickettsiales bacterium]|jgi:hypothetical protein|nr:class I SAM-dependent methyltransferase [Rickettsiales bacterium]
MNKLLLNICCAFIYKKKNRHHFREKYGREKIGKNNNFVVTNEIKKQIDERIDDVIANQKTEFEVLKLLLNNKSTSDLTCIAEKYLSDKGRVRNIQHYHTYTQIYEVLFMEYKFTAKNVFECGIGYLNSEQCKAGGSLRLWREYFPNAQIYGADINKEVLFQEERIYTDWIDQTSPEAIKKYFDKIDKKFDVMVEDGWHVFKAQNCMFENGINYLSKDGIYVIEDVMPEDLLKHQKYFSTKSDEFDVRYMQMNSLFRYYKDNNLIVIKRK